MAVMATSARRLGKWLILIALLGAPLAVLGLYRPARMLIPRLVGLSCTERGICLDESGQASRADSLFREAVQFVDSVVGPIGRPPRVVCCATSSCARTFGLGRATARTTPMGIVFGPRAWEPHYVRHELIHHVQLERLGFWRLGPVRRWRSPEWLLEGMAYALSDDPRAELAEPFEGYRTRFIAWYRTVGPAELWTAARQLEPD